MLTITTKDAGDRHTISSQRIQTVRGINPIEKSIRDMATASMKKIDKEGYDIHVVKNIRSAVKERLWPTTKFLPEDILNDYNMIYDNRKRTNSILSVILNCTTEMKKAKKDNKEMEKTKMYSLYCLYNGVVPHELGKIRSSQTKFIKQAMMGTTEQGMVAVSNFIDNNLFKFLTIKFSFN